MPRPDRCALMVADRLRDLRLLTPTLESEHLPVEADRIAPYGLQRTRRAPSHTASSSAASAASRVTVSRACSPRIRSRPSATAALGVIPNASRSRLIAP